MGDKEVETFLKEIINAVRAVVGHEKTNHAGLQDYLVVGNEVNRLIDLIDEAEKHTK